MTTAPRTGIRKQPFGRRTLLMGTAALGASALLRSTASAQFDRTQVELVWDAAGSEEVPLLGPDGMALAADGSIHVVNAKRGQIVVLSPESEFVEAWGEPGVGPGAFKFTDTY